MRRYRVMCAAVCLLMSTAVFGQWNSSAEDRATVDKARRQYYSLRRAGMRSFTCEVVPAWNPPWVSADADEIDRTLVLPFLKQFQIRVKVAADSEPRISYDSGEIGKGVSEEVQERRQRAISGVENVVRGFFATWSMTAIDTVIPPDVAHWTLEKSSPGYRLQWKESEADAEEDILDENLHVLEWNGHAFNASRKMIPTFSPTPKGLLLISYYIEMEGPISGSIDIENQEVEGLFIPAKVHVKIKSGFETEQANVAFSGCKVTFVTEQKK